MATLITPYMGYPFGIPPGSLETINKQFILSLNGFKEL